MLTLYQTLSLRYLQQRWFRVVLVVASIGLGVATLVATQALNQSLVTATRAAAIPLAGAADLHVSNGQFGVPLALGEPLRRLRGVRAVKPRLFEQAYVRDLNRTVRLIGIDLKTEIASHVSSDVHLNPLPLPLPDVKSGDQLVVVGNELFKELHEARKIHVLMAGDRTFELTPVGTVTADGFAGELVGKALFVDLASAAALLGPERAGYVSRFDLLLEPDANRGEVKRQAEALLGQKEPSSHVGASTVGLVGSPMGQGPLLAAATLVGHKAGGGEVITPETRGQDFHEVMTGLEIGFSLCGLGALVVGLFLVYNALSVTVAERRHDIGVLRSLGATRSQIAGLFVGEAALLGSLGATLGIPAGLGLAKLALGPMRDLLSDLFLPMEVAQLEKNPSTIVLAAAAGIATAVLAALVPAFQAAAQEPADAVRRAPLVPGWKQRWLHSFAIALLMAAGLACFALRDWLREYFPARTGTYGGLILLFLSAMLAMPLLAAALAGLFLPMVRQFLSTEERLAADNLVRSPGRTGLVIAALAAGVALMIETAGLIRSNEKPILRWIDDTIAADLYVSRGGPVSASGQNQPMEAVMGERLERAFPKQVEMALPVRFQPVKYRETIVLIIAADAERFYRAGKRRDTPVPGLELYPELARRPGTAVISENFAYKHGVKKGEHLLLPGRYGPVDLEIIGLVVDYSWNHGTVIVDWGHYRKQFGDDLVDDFEIYLRPGVDAAAVRQELQSWKEPQLRPEALAVLAGSPQAGFPGSIPWTGLHLGGRKSELRQGEGLVILTRDELKDRFRNMIRQLYSIAFLQELIVGVVAVLGVVMALLISVLQRRRELGLLRAVGATQSQILRTVIAEATLMGLIGTLIGVLIGVPLEWVVVRVILFEEAGLLFPIRIPWLDAGLIVAIAVAAAALAGLGPALHALRQRIPEAIAYE